MAWLLFIALMCVAFEVPWLEERPQICAVCFLRWVPLSFQKIKVRHSGEITKENSAHEADS